jgi:hypothetical protein
VYQIGCHRGCMILLCITRVVIENSTHGAPEA